MQAQAGMLPGGLNRTEIANGAKPGWGLRWDLHGSVRKRERLVVRNYISVSRPIPRAISHPMGDSSGNYWDPPKTLPEDLARPGYANGSFEIANVKQFEKVRLSAEAPEGVPEKETQPRSGSKRFWLEFGPNDASIESTGLGSTWTGNLAVNDRATIEIPGGGTARLAAYAVSVPSNLDSNDPGDFSTTRLTFRDPISGEVLGADQLAELGLDDESRSIRTFSRSEPILRLALQLQNREHMLIRGIRVFDQRTKAQIEAQTSVDVIQTGIDRNGVSVSPPEPLATHGLTTFDYPIDLWRDAPLEVAIDVLCGEPISQELSSQENAQIQFNGRIGVQNIVARAGRPIIFGKHIFELDEPSGGTSFLLRCNAPDHRRQMLFEMDGHIRALDYGNYDIDWKRPLSVWFDEVEFDAERPLTVHYFPDRATMRFKIETLPDMPNPRTNDSFHDIQIPRIT
ncbi:MAG: hypothetical protein AAF585_29025, partial [Verrucomicrobiota bacterium]